MTRWTQLARERSLLVSGGLLFTIVVVAVAAPVIAPHDPTVGNLSDRFIPPVWLPGGRPEFPFGTDQLGRDVLSRILFGTRVSLLVGVLAVAVSGVIGVGLGLISGYYRGLTDSVISRLADIQIALPFLALAIAAAAILGAGLANTIVVLGVAGWVTYARVVRAEVLSLRERGFVRATRTLGAHDTRIILRHILPNVLPSVIVVATFAFSDMVIAEATLSFLGFGIVPPTATWGRMIADARSYLAIAWWVALLPAAALAIVVLTINVLGDALRDHLDPRSASLVERR